MRSERYSTSSSAGARIATFCLPIVGRLISPARQPFLAEDAARGFALGGEVADELDAGGGGWFGEGAFDAVDDRRQPDALLQFLLRLGVDVAHGSLGWSALSLPDSFFVDFLLDIRRRICAIGGGFLRERGVNELFNRN